MRRLIFADAMRMFRNKWLWLCFTCMFSMAIVFIAMQHTAMDYSVPLSRVIFLPMSFYGMAVAAMVSLFVGEDFSDGFIKNKLISGHSRNNIFASNYIICCLACAAVYLVVTVFTASIGRLLFENDVSFLRFLQHTVMGLGMSMAFASLYCTVTMICGNKSTAIVLCMGMAFVLLCVCLHTNQIMVQTEYKNGMPNPAYVEGIIKSVYALIHDLNPFGQAAQLSAMSIFQPARWILCDIFWILFAVVGSCIFGRKNIH